MGMFDNVRCKYPLPIAGAGELEFQTKDTPEQFLENYEIREDGTLWLEDYDIEDRSEYGKWTREHPGEEPPESVKGLLSFAGFMARVNKRQVPVQFTGKIQFYTTLGKQHTGWIEFSAYFVDGKLNQLGLIEHRLPDAEQEEKRKQELDAIFNQIA